MGKNINHIKSIILISCFLFIAIALVLIRRNPSQGYEISIYNATPTLFWWLIIIAIFGGIAVVVYEVIKGNIEKDNLWKVGLSLAVLGNLVILLLPALKGYAFYGRDDELTHLGIMKDIIQYGHISSDIYPITHILIVQIVLVTKITLEYLMHFGGPISYLFFVTFIFLLCVEILPKKAAILATLAATVLTAYYYLQVLPFGMSAVFIPLILFLYFKYRKRAFAPVLIIVLILIVLLVFYHPFTSLVLAGILFIMELANPIFNKLFGRHEKQNYFYVKADRLTLNLLVISLAVLTLWLLGNYLFWSHTITNSFNWLTGEITRTNLLDRSMIGYGIEGIYKLGLRSYDIIELFIKLDGHLLIYLLVALTTFILLLRKRLPITSEESRSIFLLSIALGIFTLIGIANYFIALTILNSGSRLLQYIYPLLFPVVGLGLYKIIITGELRRGHISIIIRGFVIFTIIAVSSLICIYSIFPSPTIYDRNQEVSYKEWFGISWFLKTRNIGLEYIDIASAITPAFATALYGPLNASYPTAMPVWVGNHFNYGNNQNLGDSLTEDKYLILDNYVKLYYTEVDLTGRFNSDDFIRLESDDSVNLIYANGDVEWYYVYGLEKP